MKKLLSLILSILIGLTSSIGCDSSLVYANEEEVSLITEAWIESNGVTYQMSSYQNGYFDDDFQNYVWYIDREEVGHDKYDQFFNKLRENYSETDYKVYYKLNGVEKPIELSKDSFNYGNYKDVHGFYFEYTLKDNQEKKIEKGLICPFFDGESIPYNMDNFSGDNAYLLVDKDGDSTKETKYTYVFKEELSNENRRVYLLNKSDDYQIKENDYLNLDLGNGVIRKTWNGVENGEQYIGDGIIGVGTSFWYDRVIEDGGSKTVEPNHQAFFLISARREGEIDPNFSYINIADNTIEYECNIDKEINEVFWNIFVDAKELFVEGDNNDYTVNIPLIDTGKFNTIEYEQLLDGEYDRDEISGPDVNNVVTISARKHSSNRFAIKGRNNQSDEPQVQTHQFSLNSTYENVLKYSLLSDINFYYSCFPNYDQGTYDPNTGLFNKITLILETEDNVSDFINAISNIKETDNQNKMELEKGFYHSIVLKEGVTIESKKYSIYKFNNVNCPAVVYTLKDTSDHSQTVTLVVRQFGMNDGGDEIEINGERYRRYDIPYNSENCTVFANIKEMDFDPGYFVHFTSGKYKTLVAKAFTNFYSTDLKENIREKVCIEGKNYALQKEIMYEVYSSSGDSNFDNLQKINELDNRVIIPIREGEYNSAEEAQNDIARLKDSPVGYFKPANNPNGCELVFINKIIDNYQEFEDYDGDAECILIENENNKYFIFRYIKTKYLMGIKTYTEYDEIYHQDNTKKNANKDLINGGNGSNSLEEAVNDLGAYIESKITLKEDITLTRDTLLTHRLEYFLEGEHLFNKKLGLEIDLNGHDIDCQNFAITNTRYSQIYITNSAEKTSTIKGTGRTLFDNYGTLSFIGNIQLLNDDNTAITAYNCAGDTTISSLTRIGNDSHRVGTAILLKELSNPHNLNGEYYFARVTFNGVAYTKNFGIKAELPTATNNTYYVEFGKDDFTYDTNRYGTIYSTNSGLDINGKVNINLEAANIDASLPIRINASNLIVNNSTIKNTNQGEVKPLILVDSKSQSSGKTEIVFDMENGMELSSTGVIVGETVSNKDNSKIDYIRFNLSSNNIASRTIVCGNKLIQDNVPTLNANSSKKVIIRGGNYKSNNLDTLEAEISEYLGADCAINKTDLSGYLTVKQNKLQITVDNYNDLKTYLENDYTSDINIGSMFQDKNETEVHLITVNNDIKKSLNLDKHTLKDITLVAHSNNLNKEDTSKGFSIYNGTIENNLSVVNENDGIVLINEGANIYLNNACIISKNNAAIKQVNGLIMTHDDTLETNPQANNLTKGLIKGKYGIIIDQDGNVEGSFQQTVINGTELVGTTNSAIFAKKTNKGGEQENVIRLVRPDRGGNSSIIKTEANDVPVIFINDVTFLGTNYCNISGGNVAIKVSDDIGESEDDVATIETRIGTTITSPVGFDLSKKTTIRIQDGKFDVAQDLICAFNDTSISITYGEFSTSSQDGKFIRYKDTYHEKPGYSNITGGYFSKMVGNDEIGFYDFDSYQLVCKQVYKTGDTDYPFTVLKQIKGKKNYQNITLTSNKVITVDDEQFESAISDAERKALEENGETVDLILTIKEQTNETKKRMFENLVNGVQETYDIHINKNVGDDCEYANEVSEYQIITISLDTIVDEQGMKKIRNYGDVNHVQVWHQHADQNPAALKKINPSQLKKVNEECFYVSKDKNDNYFVTIVTKRFSTFGLAATQDEVQAVEQKPHYQFVLNYKESYYDIETVNVPTTAKYLDGNQEEQTIAIENVNVSYEGTGDTIYYSTTTFPTELGTYKVKWTVNDAKNLSFSGSGEQSFEIVKLEDNDVVDFATDIDTSNVDSISTKVKEKVDDLSMEKYTQLMSSEISKPDTEQTIIIKFKELETTLVGSGNGYVKTEVISNNDKFAREKVTIVGALLNATLGKEPKLKIDIAQQGEVTAIKEGLPNNVDLTNTISFSLDVLDTSSTSKTELDVPVMIKLPVPNSIDIDNVRLFHKHGYDVEEISIVKTKEGQTNYISFVISKFSTFVLVENKNTNNGDKYKVPNTCVKYYQ